MSLLFLKAYWQLVRFDFYLVRGDFAVLYTKVRNQRVRDEGERARSIDQICQAVDMACIWYWKQVLCLQRSAATACLLRAMGSRDYGDRGATGPFQSARVGRSGGSRGERQAVHPEIYAVLDRC